MLPAANDLDLEAPSARVLLVESAVQRGAWRRRLPAFWYDVEVRRLVIDLYGTVRLTDAQLGVAERVGAQRTPGRSSIARFWQKIDRMLAEVEDAEGVSLRRRVVGGLAGRSPRAD